MSNELLHDKLARIEAKLDVILENIPIKYKWDVSLVPPVKPEAPPYDRYDKPIDWDPYDVTRTARDNAPPIDWNNVKWDPEKIPKFPLEGNNVGRVMSYHSPVEKKDMMDRIKHKPKE